MLNRRTLLALGAATAAVATLPGKRTQAATSLAVSTQSQTIDIEGGTIAYRRFGSGRPLLFLQRFRGGMDDWDPALLDTFAAGREVILFDSLGVSESTGSAPATLEGAADIAARVIAALKLDRPDVLGWSMGAMTAQILGITHPGSVGKLILAGTTPPAGTPEFAPPSDEWLAVAGKPQYTVEDLTFLFFTKTAAGLAAGAASAARISARRPAEQMVVLPETVGAQFTALSAFVANEDGWYARLPEITAPVLVANGDRDAACPAINSVILARQIPGAQLALYPDAGHGFHFQFAERFAADAAAFLDA
jgi:pimeloyl-ACP methyl ester carboxylesterase